METQILILLLFALHTVSGQIKSIPPAPTLPSLDISSFPEYMQRLLANRPSLIYVNKPNNDRAQNENILHDNIKNYQTPGANIGIPRSNGMKPKNNQDHINNVKSSLNVPQAMRKPHTYGMNLRGDKGEIWNDLTGRHLYINDFAPTKSIHPNLLHNKEDEPTYPTTNNYKLTNPEQNDDQKKKLPSVTTVKPNILDTTPQITEKIPAIVEVTKYQTINDSYRPSNSNLKSANLYYVPSEPLSGEIPAIVEPQQVENGNQNDDSDQSFSSNSSSKPDVPYYMTAQPLSEEIPANLVIQKDDSQQSFPSISTSKPNVLYHNMSPQPLSDKIPAIVEVLKDKNVNQNNDAHQTSTPIATGKPYVPYHTNPLSLSEEVSTIADEYDDSAVNITKNENTIEIQKGSIGNLNLKDKIERSFDYINGKIGSNKEIKINQPPKSYGMKLAGDHGYVWNDLTKPGIHYNVGELDTSEPTNPTTEEEMNPSEIPTKIPNFHEEDNESNAVTTDFSTANNNEEPSTEKTTLETSHVNATTESNHIKEQNKPSKNFTPELGDLLKKYIEKFVKEEVARQLPRNGAKEDANKNNVYGNNSDGQESDKTPATHAESSNGHNNYGSIIGNGKVTNLFFFYPNDQNRKSIGNDDTILSKPIYEILGNMLNDEKTRNLPDRDVSAKSAIPTQSPVMTITTERSQQGTNSGVTIDMRIERFKDDDITTPSTAVTSEVNVTTDESAGMDKANEMAQATTAGQNNATQTSTSDSESTTVNPITGSSIDDIKTNATETESSSTDSIPNSSVKEIEDDNVTTQATTISDEAAEITTKSNIANDSANTSTDTSNENVDQTSNETQATPTISNQDAEITTISTNAENNAVTSNENVTSEGTVTADPSDITNPIQESLSETDVNDKTDNISTSSDIPLPSSSS